MEKEDHMPSDINDLPELLKLYPAPWHVTMDGVKNAQGVWIMSASNTKLMQQVCDLANALATLVSERERVIVERNRMVDRWEKQQDALAKLVSENERLRAQLVRTGEAWRNLSTLPSAPGNVQGSARIFADEIDKLLACELTERKVTLVPDTGFGHTDNGVSDDPVGDFQRGKGHAAGLRRP